MKYPRQEKCIMSLLSRSKSLRFPKGESQHGTIRASRMTSSTIRYGYSSVTADALALQKTSTTRYSQTYLPTAHKTSISTISDQTNYGTRYTTFLTHTSTHTSTAASTGPTGLHSPLRVYNKPIRTSHFRKFSRFSSINFSLSRGPLVRMTKVKHNSTLRLPVHAVVYQNWKPL